MPHTSETRSSWLTMLLVFDLCLLGLFGHLPLTALVDLSSYNFQPFSIDLLFNLVLYLLGVYIVLVSPLTKMVYPQWSDKMKGPGSSALRMFIVMALLGPPLLSFTYFMGGLSSFMDLHEALLMTIPPIVIGVLLYERYDNAFLFAGFLGLATFIPLFVVNDILSPIQTQISYLSRSGMFYLLRTCVPLLFLMFAIVWLRPKVQLLTPQDRLKNLGVLCLGLGVFGLAAQVVTPILYSYQLGEGIGSLWQIEIWWLGFILAFFFLQHRTKIGYFCVMALVWLNISIILVRFAIYFSNIDVTFWQILWFSTQLLVLGLSFWMAYVLPRLKSQFR